MARKSISTSPTVSPSVTPQQGIELINRLKEKASGLLQNRPLKSENLAAWSSIAEDYLTRIFGSSSPHLTTFQNLGRYGSSLLNASEEYYEERRVEQLNEKLAMLDGFVEILETDIGLSSNRSPSQDNQIAGEEVFLVHGRNDATRESVARFLEKLGLKVTILHEQPNAGRTIIEKFVAYSKVGFAVVLLTADDRGGLFDAPYESQSPRARQNVIFELGFFLGRLERHRVCALYQEGVELPSDYQGVLFIQLDNSGVWKFQLAKELKAAGLPIDINRVL